MKKNIFALCQKRDDLMRLWPWISSIILYEVHGKCEKPDIMCVILYDRLELICQLSMLFVLPIKPLNIVGFRNNTSWKEDAVT